MADRTVRRIQGRRCRHSLPFASMILMLAFMMLFRVEAFLFLHRSTLSSVKVSGDACCKYSTALSVASKPREEEEVTRQDGSSSWASPAAAPSDGLFRPFAEHAFNTLMETGWVQEEDLGDLANNSSQGSDEDMDDGKKATHVTVKALDASKDASPISYARIILMETQADGLQALNILVFPHDETLPLWGVSFAKPIPDFCMLTLDAQVMSDTQYEEYWKEWHAKHVDNNPLLPWGGPFRPEVAPYMSPFALWSRLLEGKLPQGDEVECEVPSESALHLYNHTVKETAEEATNSTSTSTTLLTTDTDDESCEQQQVPTPSEIIQNQVWGAYREHLDIYLQFLQDHHYVVGGDSTSTRTTTSPHPHATYCDYWRYNEPERSTLQTLFGEEWTERLLWQVMFPFSMSSSKGNEGDTSGEVHEWLDDE